MAYSYLSLTDFQVRIESQNPTANTNARHRAALEAASRAIDRYTGRQFQPYTATLYFTASRTNYLVVPDLLTLTTLKTDNNNDATYERTWDSNDYYLLPFNAPTFRQPYTAIRTSTLGAGNESFPTNPRGVEVAGVWGYWLDTEDTGATVSGTHNTTVTTLAVSDGSLIEVLDTLLIGTEAFYVTAKDTNNLTVVRGVNGTTAASLSGSEAISVYRYPEDVVEACFMQANRIQMMRSAPFGVTGGGDAGAIRLSRLHPDVKMLLDTGEYRPLTVAAI